MIAMTDTTDRQLLEKICELVETDFCETAEAYASLKRPIPQKSAWKLAKIVAEVYKYAHRIHCKSCRDKL